MQLDSFEHAFVNPITSDFSSPDSEFIGSFEEEATIDAAAVYVFFLDSGFELELVGLEVLLSEAAHFQDSLHSQSRLILPTSDGSGISQFWLGIEEGLQLIEPLLFLEFLFFLLSLRLNLLVEFFLDFLH